MTDTIVINRCKEWVHNMVLREGNPCRICLSDVPTNFMNNCLIGDDFRLLARADILYVDRVRDELVLTNIEMEDMEYPDGFDPPKNEHEFKYMR